VITAEAQMDRATAALAELPGAAERAMARALNAAAASGRQAAVKAITGRYAVRAGDVREKISLSTATPESLAVMVRAKSPALALGYFPHAPTRPGTGGRGKPPLRAEVLRGREKAVAGAFIATINGKPRVMLRTGARTAAGRGAIASVYSVPIAEMLGAPSVREAVEQRALEVLDERVDHEIDRELGRVG
jgi:hypothetical protein